MEVKLENGGWILMNKYKISIFLTFIIATIMYTTVTGKTNVSANHSYSASSSDKESTVKVQQPLWSVKL
jgi:hypothetical protein